MQALIMTLLFVNIASAGLVTGGVMVMAMAYTPLLAGLSQENTLLIHRAMGRYIDRWQPQLAWIALGSGLIELVVIPLATPYPWLALVIAGGLIGIGGLIVISITASIPLAKKIVAWTPGAARPLEQLKRSWIHVHYVRSSFGVLGFLCFVLSTLLLILFK
jgi:hypothetical protein